MSMSIENRWALVTGASRGVGFHVARALAEKGCKLIVHARQVENTLNIQHELKKMGAEVFAVGAELSSKEDVERLILEVNTITNHHLDILYNNAALMTPYRAIYEPSFEDYHLSFLVNSIVPAKLCDAFLPQMVKRNWGRVVNVSSGIADQPQLMAYSCSKAALDRYMRDMVPTLKGTNVLMNLLDPGWLSTDMGGEQAPNLPESVLPGALVPVLLDENGGSGKFFQAQDYK